MNCVPAKYREYWHSDGPDNNKMNLLSIGGLLPNELADKNDCAKGFPTKQDLKNLTKTFIFILV